MRHSPPVRVRGRGGAAWRLVTLALPTLAVASVAVWAALHLNVPDFWAWVLASKLAAVTAALLFHRRPPAHELAWDGDQWLVDGRRSQLRLMLDLGPWLLLQARPVADPELHSAPDTSFSALGCPASTWLALAASEAGPAWGVLRAAVYAHPVPHRRARRAPEHQTP